MTEDPETPIDTSGDAAETPQADPDGPRFGEAAKRKSKQKTAEDEAAEQLGNFA